MGQLHAFAVYTKSIVATLVATLLDRVYKICNSWKLTHEEFEQITKTLQEMDIPNYFIDSQIWLYLNKKCNLSTNQLNSDNNDNTKWYSWNYHSFSLLLITYKKK